MRVGIYTHYAHCDATYFAIRLADLLRQLGIEFTFYTDETPGTLGVPYDPAVIRRDQMQFTNWALAHKIIVWTHIPRVEQIQYAKRHGITTIIVPMWQDIVPPFKKTLRAADTVITLCTESHTLFSEVYKLRGAQHIPFDTGLPIIRKTNAINERSVKLLLPWFDRNARCAGGQFLDVIRFLTERIEEIQLTVAFTPSRFAPSIAKFFYNMARKCPARVHVLRGVPVTARHKLYNQHDLTIFPAECDNYGIVALSSITAGTPVLSTAISPQIDFLYPGNNAELVITKYDYDTNGVVHALPDYTKFGHAMQELVVAPRLIQKMHQSTNYNLATRRKNFELNWTNLLLS